MMNQLKTIFLMGVLTVILVAVGGAIGGRSIALVFLIISLAMNAYQYFFSDTMVIKSTGSYPASEYEYPELHRIIEGLANAAGIPKPAVYIMPTPQANAFATGRNPEHSAVVVTQGILQVLNHEELEGVLAHEITHIRHYDILISTVAASMAGIVSFIGSIARWGAIFGGVGRDNDDNGGFLVMLLAPIAALLVQLAVSRSREYAADEGAAELTRNPRGLANALIRLEQTVQRYPMNSEVNHEHMYIVKPFSAEGIGNLFSTHPSTADRVERLNRMTF